MRFLYKNRTFVVSINHDHCSLTPSSFPIDDLGAPMDNSAAPKLGSVQRVLQNLQLRSAYRGEIEALHRTRMGLRRLLKVLGDGYIEQGLENPKLRGEEAIHGRDGNVGMLADCLDGGCGIAAFEEQRPGRVDHCSAGESRAGLSAAAVAWRFALDGLRHVTIVSLSV